MEENLRRAIPILKVASIVPAEGFYCGLLGFTRTFAYRPFGGSDPCFMGVAREGATLHVSSFSGDGVAGAAVNIQCGDVDALFIEFQGRGVPIKMPPTEQSWGDRELYVVDPDGNCIRFQQSMTR